MIRVLLADDQPLLLASFATLISATPGMCVAGTARTGTEVLRRLRAGDREPGEHGAGEHGPGADVVLMDIRMPEMDGLTATREITADPALSGVRVLVLTTFEIDEYVFQALRSGAGGFLGKSTEPAELLHAIRVVHSGEALLTPAATRSLIARYLSRPERDHESPPALDALTAREREILVLVGGGLSNEDISRHLVLSPHTVKTHVNRTMTKLGAHDRAQLVVAAYESGLIRPGVTATGPPR